MLFFKKAFPPSTTLIELNFFSSFFICVDAIRKNGVDETVAYIKRLNLPITSGVNWDEDGFDIQSLFNLSPEVAFRLFFDQTMKYKPNRKTVIFGSLDLTWTYDSNAYDDAMVVMRILKFDEN